MDNYSDTFQIEKDFVIYRYLEKTYLVDTKHYFNQVELNSVEQDIVLLINKHHTLSQVWDALMEEYAISAEDTYAESLFEAVIHELIEKKMIVPGKEAVGVFGEYGKCYPLTVSIELTNQCNFKCTHCYKDADKCYTNFISVNLVEKIMNELRGKTYAIELTGGEATLHPEFSKIVNLNTAPSFSLLTNGSQLHLYNEDIIRSFSRIQISLYGCNSAEYKKYAKTNTFSSVSNGIKRVLSARVPLTIAIILRRSNIENIPVYINYLCDLGVKHIRFGTTLKLGRNDTKGLTEWDVSKKDCDKFEEVYGQIIETYPEIMFDDFDFNEEDTFDSSKDHYRIACTAGVRDIAISERGKVRPCVYMPSHYFEKLTWDEYFSLIIAGRNADYNGCIESCLNVLKAENKNLDSICPRGFA